LLEVGLGFGLGPGLGFCLSFPLLITLVDMYNIAPSVSCRWAVDCRVGNVRVEMGVARVELCGARSFPLVAEGFKGSFAPLS